MKIIRKIAQKDRSISEKLFRTVNLNSKILDVFTKGYIVLLTIYLFYLYQSNIIEAVKIIAVVLSIIILNELVLKRLIGRKRPDYLEHNLANYAFPSSHAFSLIFAFNLIMILFRLDTLFIIGMFLYVFFIGMYRIIKGYHFLGDILAGWFLGSVVSFAYYFVVYFNYIKL